MIKVIIVAENEAEYQSHLNTLLQGVQINLEERAQTLPPAPAVKETVKTEDKPAAAEAPKTDPPKRKRRTNAEIEAEKKAEAEKNKAAEKDPFADDDEETEQDGDPFADAGEGDETATNTFPDKTIDDIRDILISSPDKKEKAKAWCKKEYGTDRVTDIEAKHYGRIYDYITKLK